MSSPVSRKTDRGRNRAVTLNVSLVVSIFAMGLWGLVVGFVTLGATPTTLETSIGTSLLTSLSIREPHAAGGPNRAVTIGVSGP